MTTPQDPSRRKKQKRRRESQLTRWRDAQPQQAEKGGGKGEAAKAKA